MTNYYKKEDFEQAVQWIDAKRSLIAPDLTEREQFLADRSLGLGSSDIATILELNPYMSAYELWAEKTGRKVPDDLSGNLAVQVGIKAEPLVAELYAEKTGEKLRSAKRKTLNGFPWLGVNPDRLIVGKKKGLEIKTGRNSSEWGESGTDQVPIRYLLQSLLCAMAFDYEEWDLAALLFGANGVEFKIYTIKRNADLEETILNRASEFFIENIVKDKAPDLIHRSDFDLAFPENNEEFQLIDDISLSRVKEFKAIKTQILELETELNSLQNLLKKEIGESAGLIDATGTPVVTWKAPKKEATQFDKKAFSEAYPELAREFSTPKKASRRFLIK